MFWMRQGKLGRGSQQQHKKAIPHSSPFGNEQQTTLVGWNCCTCMTHVVPVLSWHIRAKKCKKSYFVYFFLFFCLMSVRYLPGMRISEIRDFFFHGPIWIRLKIATVVALGRCRGLRTSRQDRRSTHVNDASVPRCRGLLQPAPPPDCSWLSKAP